MMLYRLDAAGRNTWASHVRKLSFKYGFVYAWISQEIGNPENFIRLFTDRVKDCCKQNWFEKLGTSSKAESYREYKTLLDTERYLFLDMPYELRRVFARFRCSNHDLMIEKGRHTNIDREYRYCTLCFRRGILVTETELHFLLECNAYEGLRK